MKIAAAEEANQAGSVLEPMASRLLDSPPMKKRIRSLAVAARPPALLTAPHRRPLQIGFLPENDCAPLVLAQEFGLFQQHGLTVDLHCEPSWKQLHDKIINRQFDAVAAPAALPFLINLGLTPENVRCTTGLILSLDGNAITLSRRLWSRGVRDAAGLREEIRRRGRSGTYTFGVACVFSAQYFLLCQWLRSAGVIPHVEVRIESVPPAQMFPLLKLGYLDGYCAGEPWTSVAVHAGVGVCLSSSRLLSPAHPEKVLMVREDFAKERAEEHEALLAALLNAGRLCDQPGLRAELCERLAQPHWVNAPADCLKPGLIGPFGRPQDPGFAAEGLHTFHRDRANEPTQARAEWIISRLYSFLRWRNRPKGLKQVFRADIYRRAKQRIGLPNESAEPALVSEPSATLAYPIQRLRLVE